MANCAEQDTQHGLLVVWGQFAREIGLISGLKAVKLNQKTCEHSPQAKVLEFLVAILSGAKYLQEISLAAHPLDKDLALAQAWGQSGWADYSGVSRTLSGLGWADVRALVGVLEQISQPFIDQELNLHIDPAVVPLQAFNQRHIAQVCPVGFCFAQIFCPPSFR